MLKASLIIGGPPRSSVAHPSVIPLAVELTETTLSGRLTGCSPGAGSRWPTGSTVPDAVNAGCENSGAPAGVRAPVSDRSCVVWPLLVAACLVLVASIPALAAGSPELNKRLEAVLKRELPPNVHISLQVADLQTGQVLMERTPDLPLVPASTMKVVTSSAALSTLNPDFVFITEVLVDKVKASSVGNIYLKGFGDPYLVTEQLFKLTKEVRDKGLTEVRGNIVVDDSYFIPGEPIDEQEKLGHRAYHAPYSALSLNFNSVKITVHPGAKVGDPAKVLFDPVSEYLTVKGGVKTVKGNHPANLAIERECTPKGRDVILISGTIGTGAPSKSRYVNVCTPSLYAGEVFKEFLLREGIKVNGKVVQGKVPPTAVSYYKFESLPLGIVVYYLNKYSNNVMAELLGLAVGAAAHGAPGTREKGLAVIRKHLLSIGVDEGLFALSEASGLSRNNRLSASALVRCLLSTARSFPCNVEFMSSLGVAGTDGTLKEKFTDQGARRRIRAKTGTLRGVNGLAGFGHSREGTVFAFAVLVNSGDKVAGFIDYGERITRAILDMPLGKSSSAADAP